MRTLLEGEGEGVSSGVGEGGTDCSGKIEGEGDSPIVGATVGVGDSCASAIDARVAQESEMRKLKRRSAICDLSIVAPVHVRKNIVPPLAVA